MRGLRLPLSAGVIDQHPANLSGQNSYVLCWVYQWWDSGTEFVCSNTISVFFLLCLASSPDAVHVVLDRHLVTGQNENSTLPAVQNLLILCNVRWGKMGLKSWEQPVVSIFWFQEHCPSKGVFPLGFLLKCVSLLFDQASQAVVSSGKEHLSIYKKKMKMCGEMHSCSGTGKVKCWIDFTKHFCSGKHLLFLELWQAGFESALVLDSGYEWI